ncbi:hypothetical protein DIS18_07990 [Algibacter marinivivus]|uniref:Secretion system C-terminal sorting domain-containing protein n=1 Tax=Algibacter marinivivus TaxID=2100723 RepID=A0A2U2X9K1_9FLAO|nr:T9SS type A sorting domain-containing protein [Algibacter marinivivus]PWH84454.1 hypothetical protein DIS18_07990 [Algibacter marinivivus]
MKKITLKISAFLLFATFALQVQGQACPEIYTADGVYKISTCGLTPELYMTINASSGQLEWAAEETGALEATQNWTIQDHGLPASGGYIQVTANLTPGPGDFTLIVDQTTLDATGSDPEIQINVRPGLPIIDAADPNYGWDQFQRRRESGWGGPGNNALFAKPSPTSGALQGNLRYRDAPSAAGDPVLFQSPGSITAMRMVLVSLLSTEDFDTSSIFISNPVNDELSIKGLTANVKQVSVYSLLGKEVISTEVNDKSELNIDVSALSTGMYLVKMQGEKGSYTKKIVKQ